MGDNSGTTNTVMPVQPMGNGMPFGGYNGGFGGGYGDGGWWWLILLFLVFGNGWGNGNGFGNGGGGAFPWLLAANQGTTNAVNSGFDNAALTGQLSAIQAAINSGFSTAEVAACGRAMDQMQTDYSGQIAALNRSFDAQTANTAGMTALQAQLAQCCCDNRLATAQTQALVQSENCADRYEAQKNTQAIIDSQARGTQAILDKLCQQEIDAKNTEISRLNQQVLMRDLAASQAAQTAQLIADNTAQTQYVVNRVAPYPIPSYTVANPYGGCNCGNSGFGRVGYGNGTF